jgi:hypothetical protein
MTEPPANPTGRHPGCPGGAAWAPVPLGLVEASVDTKVLTQLFKEFIDFTDKTPKAIIDDKATFTSEMPNVSCNAIPNRQPKADTHTQAVPNTTTKYSNRDD